MAFILPTTQEQFDTFLANLESNLNQDSPLNDKAFLRVLAVAEAGQYTGINKWAAQAVKACLAITAIGGQLDVIGNNYGVIRKAAEPAQFTIELPALTGTIIPITNDFAGDANGIRYSIDASATAVAGIATIQITAKTTGTAGNLNVSDTLTIGSPVSGAESQAEITVITNTGTERETDNNYRIRILDIIRATPGGGNSADYRIWAQEVAGVVRAYPFAGKPVTSALASAPPDRTVYVESTTAIDPDGIPPSSLLDEVRASITADPVTGISRQPLGLTDDTLYVEPIIRTTFYVTVSDLVVDSSIEAQTKSDIEDALDIYFRIVRPFVDGLDSPIDRNDAITDPKVSEIVQDVVGSVGGSVGGVAFDVAPGSSISRYQLNPNETAKLGAVAYV